MSQDTTHTFKVGECICNHIHGYIIAEIEERRGIKYMRLAPYHRNLNHGSLVRQKERKYGAKVNKGIGGDEEVTLGYYTFCADGTWYRTSNGEGGHQESWMQHLADSKLATQIKAGLHSLCSFEKGPLALLPLKKKRKRKVFFNIIFLDCDDGYMSYKESQIIQRYAFTDTATFKPKHIDSARTLKKLRRMIFKKLASNGEKHHYIKSIHAGAEPFRRNNINKRGYIVFSETITNTYPGVSTRRVYYKSQNLTRNIAGSRHLMRIANISDVHLAVCVCYKKK